MKASVKSTANKGGHIEKDVKDAARMSLLFDYYGQLLSERQQEIFSLYHEDNYSRGEIGKEYSISRQGVHDALKKGETALVRYEAKLGLIAKHEEYLHALKSVEETAKKLIADEAISSISVKKDEDRIKRRLRQIKKTVSDLDI
jgi:predicted DNA-binding protein YlxM (UPF0122 family)